MRLLPGLARALLVVQALLFLWIGIWTLAAPEDVARLVEIELPSDSARIDFAAFYGGFEVGVGLFLGWCALRRGRLVAGLAAILLGSGCTGLSRLWGMLQAAGPVLPSYRTFLAVELGAAVLAAILLAALARARRREG
jgi:hypothetical protein